MLDVAETQGIRIDTDALEKSLGLPVVPMVATKNRGIRELVQRIISVSRREGQPPAETSSEVREDHRRLFQELTALIRDVTPSPYTVPWVAAKLMEGDPEISAMMEGLVPAPAWEQVRSLLIAHEDSLHAVVCGRYDWVEEITRACVSRFRMGQVVMTDRIDHVLTRPVFGIPVLLAVLGCVFFLTYKVGFPLQKLLEEFVGGFTASIEPLLTAAPAWLRGLLVDGVIGGVGSVLTFLPILLIFFAALAFLEDVGYMARAAFVMDRFMHLVGLHGKSFIPMCLGFGCNVPAILGARIIESKKARLLTMLLTPFVPCTARLAVLTFITAAVFAAHATAVVWSLVALNILILGATGMVVHVFFLKEEATPFIMELPLYHRPDPRTITHAIRARTVAFVRRAGTVILTVSILVWLLSYFPDGRTETSILAWIGRFLEPIGRPLGLDWKMMTALLTSLAAKENAVATLGVLYGVGEQGLLQTLPSVMSHASALSFLTVADALRPLRGDDRGHAAGDGRPPLVHLLPRPDVRRLLPGRHGGLSDRPLGRLLTGSASRIFRGHVPIPAGFRNMSPSINRSGLNSDFSVFLPLQTRRSRWLRPLSRSFADAPRPGSSPHRSCKSLPCPTDGRQTIRFRQRL